MANIVERQILVDGPRKVVLAVYLKSDGATGELDKETLLDLEDVDLEDGSRFSIQKICYNFAGFDAVIAFDAGVVTPNRKWVLTEGTNASVDFTPFGGLQDDSDEQDRTGTLQISTTGFTSSQDQGSIILLLNKKPA